MNVSHEVLDAASARLATAAARASARGITVHHAAPAPRGTDRTAAAGGAREGHDGASRATEPPSGSSPTVL